MVNENCLLKGHKNISSQEEGKPLFSIAASLPFEEARIFRSPADIVEVVDGWQRLGEALNVSVLISNTGIKEKKVYDGPRQNETG